MLDSITRFSRHITIAMLVSLAGACDVPDELEDELLEDELLEDELEFRIGALTTGRRLNTNHAGNHWFSELHLGGMVHEGTRLDFIQYDGPYGNLLVIPSSITVVDGELHALLEDGTPIVHHDFGQTRWHIEVDGPGVTYQYELMVEPTKDPDTNTPLYVFWWSQGPSEGWLPTCVMDEEEPEMTAAVYADLNVDEQTGAMTAQPELLYIGCTAGAVGKASLWGYRPDYGPLPAAHGANALPVFNASVRMLRADYCGDGVSWTQPGTPVYLKDKMGINDSISGLWVWPGPQDEAVWGQNGAMCLALPRIHGLGAPTPTCANGSTPPPCWFGASGWFSDPSALFWTASEL